MMEFRTGLVAGLWLLLAAAPEARPQPAQSGLPLGPVTVRKIGKSGSNGSSRPTGATAEVLPGLCFQPGVGWRRVPIKRPDGPVTRDANTSIGPKELGSASGANTPLVYPRLSSVKRAHSVDCPAVLTDKQVTGAGVGNVTVRSPLRTMRSGGPANPRTLTSLQLHSPYDPNGRTGLGTLPGATPSSPIDFASQNGRVSPADQLGDRAFHAYVSSVKLRRLIRDAPDFHTRITLQQLQDNPASPSQHAGTQASRRVLKRERASRASSLRSHRRDQPRYDSQSLGVRP